MKPEVNERFNQPAKFEMKLETDKVRGRIRKLISNWRKLNRAQTELNKSTAKPQNKLDPQAEQAIVKRPCKLSQYEIGTKVASG